MRPKGIRAGGVKNKNLQKMNTTNKNLIPKRKLHLALPKHLAITSRKLAW